jgi:hypothetical protein
MLNQFAKIRQPETLRYTSSNKQDEPPLSYRRSEGIKIRRKLRFDLRGALHGLPDDL